MSGYATSLKNYIGTLINGGKDKNKLVQSREILTLSIDDIEPSPFQARTFFDELELEALSNSIAENGLLQPVSVIKLANGKYQLIAGERRLRASKKCGLTSISAICCEAEEQHTAVLSYLENLQRSQLNIFDHARAIKQLLEIWRCTQDEAAKRLSMSQSAIANKLRLLAISEEQQKLLLENSLTERHARAVLRINNEDIRRNFIQTVVKRNLNVAQSEALVERFLAAPTAQKKKCITMVRDVRLFVNTINKAISVMQNSGIDAVSTQTENEDFIEYNIKIPTANSKKSSAQEKLVNC